MHNFNILLSICTGLVALQSLFSVACCVPISDSVAPEMESQILGDEILIPRNIPTSKANAPKVQAPAVPSISSTIYKSSTPTPERNKFGELIHGNWQNVFKNVVALPSKVVSRIKGAVDGYLSNNSPGPQTEKRIITVDLPLPDLPYFDETKKV